jgi:hypothetical protein
MSRITYASLTIYPSILDHDLRSYNFLISKKDGDGTTISYSFSGRVEGKHAIDEIIHKFNNKIIEIELSNA